MSANRLYHTWFEQIRQMHPGARITRVRNLVWLMVGIYQSKSVHSGLSPALARYARGGDKSVRVEHPGVSRIRQPLRQPGRSVRDDRDKVLAIENYEKALALDPSLPSAIDVLEKLRS